MHIVVPYYSNAALFDTNKSSEKH